MGVIYMFIDCVYEARTWWSVTMVNQPLSHTRRHQFELTTLVESKYYMINEISNNDMNHSCHKPCWIWVGCFLVFGYNWTVVRNPIIRGGIEIPLIGLTSSPCCACLKPELGYTPSYVVVFFMFNCLRLEMIVCVVDIGVIVDLLFIRV